MAPDRSGMHCVTHAPDNPFSTSCNHRPVRSLSFSLHELTSATHTIKRRLLILRPVMVFTKSSHEPVMDFWNSAVMSSNTVLRVQGLHCIELILPIMVPTKCNHEFNHGFREFCNPPPPASKVFAGLPYQTKCSEYFGVDAYFFPSLAE